MRAIASSPPRARATLPSSHQPPVRGGGSKRPAAALLRARLLGCSCNSGNIGSVSQFEQQGTALENRQYTGVPFRFPRNTSRSFRVSNSMLGLWRTTPQDYPEGVPLRTRRACAVQTRAVRRAPSTFWRSGHRSVPGTPLCSSGRSAPVSGRERGRLRRGAEAKTRRVLDRSRWGTNHELLLRHRELCAKVGDGLTG